MREACWPVQIGAIHQHIFQRSEESHILCFVVRPGFRKATAHDGFPIAETPVSFALSVGVVVAQAAAINPKFRRVPVHRPLPLLISRRASTRNGYCELNGFLRREYRFTRPDLTAIAR